MPLTGSVFKSERFVLGIQVNARRWNMLQVLFNRADGSIFVTFPYFQHKVGIVSKATLPSGPAPNLELEPGGRISSHLVKYSHHPDGTVLFSQTGRVLSLIRKHGIPLAQLDGHFFSVHAQPPESFQAAGHRDQRPPNAKRTALYFDFETKDIRSVKFVGRAFSGETLERRSPNGRLSPKMGGQLPDGSIHACFVLSSPDGTPGSDTFLLVSCEEFSGANKDRPSLLFLGGFDKPEISSDNSQPTTLLSFSYPVEDDGQLRDRIGSIDFIRSRQGVTPDPITCRGTGGS